MAILKKTTPGGLGKYTVPVMEMLTESMSKRTAVKSGTKSYTIKNTAANKKTIKQFVELGSKGAASEKKAFALELETVDGHIVQIGDLNKPNTNPNIGDMLEGVQACAIAARFIHKNQDITSTDVVAILRKLAKGTAKNYPGKSGKYVEKHFVSPNRNPKFKDDVKIYISLAEVNMSTLLKSSTEKLLSEYIKGTVLYANSSSVAEWSKTLYENNRVDQIEVISDGLGGQGTTKVDLRVKVSDDRGKIVPVNINLSMKAGDVKQFGQVSGAEFEKQEDLWERIFGYGSAIKSLKKKYETLMFKKKKPEDAVALVYNHVCNKLKTDLRGSKSQTILRKLSDAITYFATLDEENVKILQISKGTAALYSFENVYEDLKNNDFSARIVVGKSEMPSLVIHAGNKDLLKIRVKQEFKSDGKPYIRNYIEKEKLFTELFAVYL